jgi:hypothetical protein
MIQGLLIKKVLDLVMGKIMKKYNLDKIKKYVDEPNELDDEVKDLKFKVALLEKMAHPERNMICKCCKEKEE